MTERPTITELRQNTFMPKADYIEVGPDYMRITYVFYGEEKHIFLESIEQSAMWLEEQQYIEAVLKQKDTIIMRVETLGVYYSPDEVVEIPQFQYFTWKDLQDAYFDRYHPLNMVYNRELLRQTCVMIEWNAVVNEIMKESKIIPDIVKA